MRSSTGKGKNREGERERERERERNGVKEDVRRVERIGRLHVALFLVLLSPGYNPPRRRWCLYLSRGKPPSVRVSLSPAFPPHSTFSLPHSLSIHLLAARSPSELHVPSPPSAIHPPSPRHTLCSPLFSPDSTHQHPLPSTRFPSSPPPRLALSLYPHPPTLLTSAFIRRSNSPQHTPC